MAEFGHHVVAAVAFIAIVLLVVGLATKADQVWEDWVNRDG